MLRRILRRLRIIVGADRRAVLDAMQFAHGALTDACFSEHWDVDASRSVLDMIEVELRKHNQAFTSYIVDDDTPVT